VKVHDTLSGAVVVALGLVVWLLARALPDMTYFRYGPGFFPGLIGGLLVVIGGLLALRDLASLRREPLVRLAPWARSGRHRLDALAAIGAVVAYALLVDRLGFLPTAFLLLFLLVWRLWRRPVAALAVALAGTLATHQVFVELLLVPLPWGLLEPLSGTLTWR
jgi:putative tricarboxylic transport membrane protein